MRPVSRCIIVGAGDFDKRYWKYEEGDYVIAADAGCIPLEKLGIVPDLLIGDMDSLREQGRNPADHQGNKKILPEHKDDTDMLAAIRYGLEMGYRIFYIHGALGGRLDHTLANIQCLLFLQHRGATGYLYGDGCSLELLCNGTRFYPATMKGRISVFAYGGQAKGVTEKGLAYTVENAVLEPEFPIGVSNEFMGCDSSIQVKSGMLLLYTEL